MSNKMSYEDICELMADMAIAEMRAPQLPENCPIGRAMLAEMMHNNLKDNDGKEQPTVEQPTVEQPTVEQPTVEQPTVEQPTK